MATQKKDNYKANKTFSTNSIEANSRKTKF